MASTYPTIQELYRETLSSLSASPEEWRAFLASAGRNYKLTFPEQVLVYAQRPDAVAVLELERWNKVFGRRVRRGSVGIAVFGEPGTGKLRYYFDVSDTAAGEGARPLNLWSPGPGDEPAIEGALRSAFGTGSGSGAAGAILDAAAAILEPAAAPHLEALGEARRGSGLEGLPSSEAEALFMELAAESAGYEIAARCGLEGLIPASPRMEGALRLFDTTHAMSVLGCAVSDTAETALRELAAARGPRANRTFAPDAPSGDNPNPEPAERSEDETFLRGEGRNDGPAPDDGGGPGGPGSVRGDERRAPEGTQTGPPGEPAGRRGADEPSGRDGEAGAGDGGRPDGAHGGEPGSRRGHEVGRPDGLGGEDGRDPGGGALDGDPRAGLRLGQEPPSAGGSERATGEAGGSPASPVPGQKPAEQEQLPILFPEADRAANRRREPPLERLRANILAIETLLRVEEGGGDAGPGELAALAGYVGWGGLADVFDESSTKWPAERERLRTLLTGEEWSAARASTLTAFYTPPGIVRPIWEAIEAMGFAGGSVLEPSCGTGAFFRGMPESLAGSRLVGVELDPLTARIARALNPDSDIRNCGFEGADLADDSFDVAIGNVPFGSYQVDDPRHRGEGLLVHDYFFARALDLVRPGGVVAFVTSKGTLGKKNGAARRRLAERAELLGAVRLPSTAFAPHTEVTADVVVMQKRARPEACDPEWVHTERTETGVEVNSYFVSHPEMVLGELAATRNAYGRADVECRERPGSDLEADLREALGRIAASMPILAAPEPAPSDGSVPADPRVRDWSYAEEGGTIYFRMGTRMHPQTPSKTAAERIRGMMGVRDCARRLIGLESDDAPESEIEEARARLNGLYDAYTAKHGLLSSRANAAAFKQDSSYPLLCALEVLDEDGGLLRKADILRKRTIRPNVPVESADTPQEALAASLSERGKVDLPYMARLAGVSEDEVAAGLAGQIFRVPDAAPGEPEWQPADEYLSGNVRAKLRVAEAAAAADPTFAGNAEALRAALPPDIGPADIGVRLGATWIPPDDVRDFVIELLEPPYWVRERIAVRYSAVTAQWRIEGKGRDGSNVRALSTYGTRRMSAYQIIEETLNLKDARVVDYTEDENGRKKAVLNRKETAVALAKQDAIKSAFKEWVFSDAARRERLTAVYNERFNSTRPREFDGSHLRFPGMNPEIELRPHQRNAVARILYGGNALLAHEVGAGKTFTMAAAAMELRRMGLCSKPMFVVPNHLTGQWASEWMRLYPAANLLVATKRDFERQNRKRFCARIASGDWDGVIIGHTQFEKIPVSVDRQRAFIEEQIAEIADGISDLKAQRGERFGVKQMEATKKRLEARLAKLADQSDKDDVLTFEELGVDRIFVDEAHYYKNLFFHTKMRNVGGIAQSEAKKSSDLFMKCRILDRQTGGRGTVFATGTPVSNSMAELYTMQRYLQYGELERLGLSHFDCWASTFGETVTALELAPEGTGYRQKTRFSRFYNLPELMATFKQVADVQTADMLELPVPRVRQRSVAVQPSPIQRELVAGLAERADAVRAGRVPAEKDNMLLITNDGRKIALDQRLQDPALPDFAGSKVNACVENVLRIWESGSNERLTQLVFCDLSTPKGGAGFSVYDDLRRKLVERGVPDDEIAFIHDADTEAKKLTLFGRVNSGAVRILMGSTQKMGAGTNVQRRLVAIHDLDCPWRPADLQQRLGRIERQGNMNEEVEAYRYVTEGTFDAYLYQVVEGKQRFIGQVMTSKSPVRSASDVDEAALSYAELKALATGNPLIKERMDLEVEVSRLRVLKADHLAQRYALEDKAAREYPERIAALASQAEKLEADAERARANPPPAKEAFLMEVRGTVQSGRAAAGEAIIAACGLAADARSEPLGAYRGFSLELSFNRVDAAFEVVIVGDARHRCAMGSDPSGIVTRIDNAMARIPRELEDCRAKADEAMRQLAAAREEASKPFPHEERLREKSARLAELDALLDMGKGGPELLCEGGEDGRPVEKELLMER